uniref:Uncharacterized protein n=1 Tax=Ditylenchus dipsaci TaxID=166011 RepID=A0A915DYP7_9BILA
MVMVSRNATRSCTRSFGPDDQQQEVMGLVLPEKTNNSVVMSSTQPIMPNTVKTTDKPVVVFIAPRQCTAIEDKKQNADRRLPEEKMRKEFENLNNK